MIPQLLLITGSPGAGKSSLASRLAGRYGACTCSKDEIKELLFDTLGIGDAAQSRAFSDAAYAVLFAFLPRLLASHRLLVAEANFRAGEHELPIARALAEAPVDVAQILCSADPAVCAARLAGRAADPARHPGHRDGLFDPRAAGPALPLELPGPRFGYRSDAAADADWEPLCGHLDRWCRTGPRLPPLTVARDL